MTKLIPKQSKDDYMQTSTGKVANFQLPEVEVVAKSPTGDAWKDRNLYQAYKGRRYINEGRQEAKPLALGLAGLTALPGITALAPAVSATLNNPYVNAVFTADGVRNALSGEGIQKTYRLAKEGDYWGATKSGAIDALDLWGGYGLLKTGTNAFKNRYLFQQTPNSFTGGIGSEKGLEDLKVLGQYLKDLRYELDPRYRRVYHRTKEPFDINNFNTGTSNDAGLHVSIGKPAKDIFGSVIYKGYSRKPDFRFIDMGSNGTNMFNTNYTFENPSWINTGNDKFSKNVYKKMFGNQGKWTKLDNGGTRLEFSGAENKATPVNMVEHVFPNQSKDFKQKLSEFYRVGTYVNDAKTKAQLNSELAKFLSDNNFKVGVYNNNHYDEMVGDAYSIFSNDAVKNWTRIQKFGGALNKNVQPAKQNFLI